MKSLDKTNVYIASFGVFAGAFLVTLSAASIFAPYEDTNADILRVEQDNSGYTASISSADTVNIDLSSTVLGTTATASDVVNVTTNSPNGYKLYVSSTATDSTLYKDGNSTSSYFISPTTGTFTAPDILSSNTWGFNLTGDNAFAAMPGNTSPQLIDSKTTATSATGNNLTVYYGVNTTTALPSGTYVGQIRYTISTETSVSGLDATALRPTVIDADANTELTIATSLYTNYAFSNADIQVKIGDNLCGVQTIDTSTGALTFTCVAPKLSAGTYTVTISIPKFGKTYTLSQALTYYTVPEFFKISNMQEITSAICASATTPSTSASYADTTGVHTGDTSYVPQRVLYDIRDGNSYRIRKLADGNCWMTENLRLVFYNGYVGKYNESTNTISGTNVKITPENSNVTSTYFPSGHYTTTDGNGVDWQNDSSTVLRSHYSKQLVSAQSEQQTAGGYYNQLLRNLGVLDDTIGSICPKGWQMPPATGNKSISNIFTTVYGVISTGNVYGDDALPAWNFARAFPLSIAGSGIYQHSTSPSAMNSSAEVALASIMRSEAGQILRISGNNAETLGWGNIVWGRVIRCVNQ